MFRFILSCFVTVSALSTGVRAVTVDNATALKSALDAAVPGDTVLLAPGTYGMQRFGYTFAGPVYVAAADTADMPLFNRLQLNSGSKNLVFEYLAFRSDSRYADGSYHDLIRNDGTSRITFDCCTFTGITIDNDSSAEDGYGNGYGIKGASVESLTVRNCEFTNLAKCMSVDLTDSYIGFNYFHHYRSDALYLVPGTGVVFENNIVYAPRPFVLDGGAADHPDAFQGNELKDIIIRNNLINQGPGVQTQGFFLHGTGRADAGNVLIENNILYTGMANALELDNLPNSTVRNNLVLMNLHDMADPPKMLITGGMSANILVENNIAEKINITTSVPAGAVTLVNNIDCQRNDPESDWYYGDIFAGAMDDSAATFESFFLADGALDTFSVKPGVDYTRFTQFGLWSPVSGIDGPAEAVMSAVPAALSGGCYDMSGRFYPETAVRQLPAGVYVRTGADGPAAFTVLR